MSNTLARTLGRQLTVGFAWGALAACSSSASPGDDAGTGASQSSSSGGSSGASSSSSSGTGLSSGSSSSSGGLGSGSSSSSGGAGSSSGASSSGGSGSGSTGSSSGDGGMADGGGSGEGGPAGCPAGATFCDDFEASAMLGTAWTMDNTLNATIKVVNAYTTTPGPMMAHSGKNSVQINFTTGAGYAMIVEKMGFPAPMGYWARVWEYIETPMDTGHDVYIEGSTGVNLSMNGVRALNTQGGNPSLNVDYPPSNAETSANVTPATLPRGAWTCFEWHVSTTNVTLYVGGAMMASGTLTLPAPAVTYAAAQTEQRIGYERYAPSTTGGNLWIDDYAIGTARLGCM